MSNRSSFNPNVWYMDSDGYLLAKLQGLTSCVSIGFSVATKNPIANPSRRVDPSAATEAFCV